MQHDSLSPVERIRLALQASPDAARIPANAPVVALPNGLPAAPTDVYAWEISFDAGQKSIVFAPTLVGAAERAAAAPFGSVRGIRRLAKRL